MIYIFGSGPFPTKLKHDEFRKYLMTDQVQLYIFDANKLIWEIVLIFKRVLLKNRLGI